MPYYTEREKELIRHDTINKDVNKANPITVVTHLLLIVQFHVINERL